MINSEPSFVGNVLLMAHLFAGVVIGLVLWQLTGQRWTVAAAAIGSIFPDLVDKPLGHFLLSSQLDNGRIFCHALLFLLVCLLIAFALYRHNGSYIGIAFALGVLSHQYLDLMFLTPTSWFWPGFGPFPQGHYPDYLRWGVTAELTAPYEYLFGLLSLVAIAYAYGLKLIGLPHTLLVKNGALLFAMLLAISLLLLGVGVALLLSSLTVDNADYLMAGGLCMAGALVLKNFTPASLPRRGRSMPPRR